MNTTGRLTGCRPGMVAISSSNQTEETEGLTEMPAFMLVPTLVPATMNVE